MPLSYHPQLGEILLCNYDTGFLVPEMTKRRPVVVVTPRLRRRYDLVGVVPLSTTPPRTVERHHREIILSKRLPAPFSAAAMWAKCDMYSVVALRRLDRFRVRGAAGRRYVSGALDAAQLREVRAGLLIGLGLDSLTVHLPSHR